MGLVTNIFRDSSIPITSFGGIAMSSEFNNFNKQENWIILYAGQGGISQKTSLPRWNRAPVAWRLPLTGGEISSNGKMDSTGTIISNGVLGAIISVNFDGYGTISSAEASLLAYLVATMLGEGLLSANSVGGLLALCDLTGLGTIQTANLDDGITRISIISEMSGDSIFDAMLVGGKYIDSEITGTSNLESALGALAGMISEIIGTGNLNSATPSAKANIQAIITPFTELSPESLAANVWNSIAAKYNITGTMGQKLNLASSGGVDYEQLSNAIWESLQVSYQDPDTLGGIISILNDKVDELHKLQGLDPNNPMTVTKTSRMTGSIELELSGDGIEETVVTRL
jgi:hypothetical protein